MTNPVLKLDANEGPVIDPAPLLDTIADELSGLLREYPRGTSFEEALAERFEVAPDRVLIAAGGDEILDRCFRAFGGPGRNVVLPEPSFSMLRHYANTSGTEVHSVAWPSGDYPIEAVLEAIDTSTAMVFVVSPNNPTGAVATVTDIEATAAAAPDAVLVLDAAYAEFAEVDLTQSALGARRVIVVRTFSKAWSLAGCRVGYAIGSTNELDALRRVASPYPVSRVSLALARARLERDAEQVAVGVERVQLEVRALQTLLAELGVETQPSQANFVLLRVPDPNWVRDAMLACGVAVRTFPGAPMLEDAVRISCPGNATDFERLTRALRTVFRPDAVLFDVDGVLADVSQSYRVAIRETARDFGAAIDDVAVNAAKVAGNANDDWQLTTTLIREAGIDASLEDVTARFEELYQGTDEKAGLCERESLMISRDALRRIADRFRTGIVTGRPQADAARFLERTETAALLPTVVCREDAPLKPNPASVRLAMTKASAETAWFVGDTPDDVVAARGAGALPIGVLPPGAGEELRAALLGAGAATVLETTDQIQELLR